MYAAQRTLRWLVAVPALVAFGALAAPRVEAQSDAEAEARDIEKKELRYKPQPPPAKFTPPALSIAQPVWDWGTVLRGEVVTHSFSLENTGGMPLKLERVKPACGCTTVKHAKVIPPGKTGNVTLRIDTKRFSGSLKKTASVYSNASRDPYRLTMKGTIETPLEFDPRVPRINHVRGTDTEPMEITVKRSSQREVEFLGVQVDEKKRDLLDARLEEVRPGEEYRIIATPTIPESAGKYHSINLGVKTKVDGKPLDIPVRVSVRVRDRIEAVPPSIYFTRRDTAKLQNAASKPIQRAVRVKTLDPDHSFEITGVKVLGTNFETKVETVRPGKEYQLITTLAQRPAGQSRRLVEKIVVSTDDELVPEITLNATASFGLSNRTRNRGN